MKEINEGNFSVSLITLLVSRANLVSAQIKIQNPGELCTQTLITHTP